mgnify:FL=1
MPPVDNLSRLRQSLTQLRDELARLILIFLGRDALVRGSVYQLRRKCGKASCVCVTEKALHATTVLSWSEGGRTRLQTVPREDLLRLRNLTAGYQRFRKARTRLVKVQAQMIELINKLEAARREEP